MEKIKIKKVDFYYFNDKQMPVRIAVNKLDKQTVVLPQKMKKFTIEMPETCDIFIKEWTDNLIFISYIAKEAKL